MKYVKTLTLAALATTVLMAALGVGTASATVLCKVEGAGAGTTCPAGEAYTAGTEFHARAGNPKITTNSMWFFNIECKEATMGGQLQNEGGASEATTILIEELTFGGCLNCEVKLLKLFEEPEGFEVHWIPGTGNGEATFNGAITTKCQSGITGTVHCGYWAEQSKNALLTANWAVDLEIVLQRLPGSNPLCVKEVVWDGSYEITSPKPVFVTGHT